MGTRQDRCGPGVCRPTWPSFHLHRPGRLETRVLHPTSTVAGSHRGRRRKGMIHEAPHAEIRTEAKASKGGFPIGQYPIDITSDHCPGFFNLSWVRVWYYGWEAVWLCSCFQSVRRVRCGNISYSLPHQSPPHRGLPATHVIGPCHTCYGHEGDSLLAERGRASPRIDCLCPRGEELRRITKN